ncbi:cation/multidrug efflux pump [Thiohalobacter thiocyanaticus]|uniref:Cation/multidrug efflux pump n=1 Tax=Thiohalobacter thiocyanaticus TaxID=585455 RepID=A0A1Z4VTE3_9GAMM|nr:cation/multidrug efflux pump [Thiohalobacter thiocyanaticus]
MEILGTHKVTYDLLRTLAIQCHALDLAAYHLFVDSTCHGGLEKTKAAYQELFTASLLNLAIGLRTKFYQGVDHASTVAYVSNCGFLYKYRNNADLLTNFSIKDVCDKIIHADSVSRYLENGVKIPTTTFRGAEQEGKRSWELSMSVSLFSEGVLNWIDGVESANT